MKRILLAVFFVLAPLVAFASAPVTTQVSQQMFISQCLANEPVLGSGAGSPTVCSNGSLVLASGKTFTVNNSLTISGTDSSTLNIGTGGTLGSNAFNSTLYGNVFNSGTPTNGQYAEWTNATTLEGVTPTGTGSPVAATSPTITTPNVVGETSGASQTSGNWGYEVTATASSVSLTSGSFVNLTSITLGAGKWRIWGGVALTGATTATGLSVLISETSASSTPVGNDTFQTITGLSSGTTERLSAGQTVVNITSSTTYYLNAELTFTGSADGAGTLSAIEVP